MNKLKIKAFTLVELIIVITILVILATISFVSFNGYTKTARDSARITTIKNISKGIETYLIKTGNVPNLDNQFSTGSIGVDTLSYVGSIGENVSRVISMSEVPKDPLTGNNYIYGIDSNKTKYQIGGVKEEGLVSKVEGNYNGLLKNNSKIYNIPSLIYTGSGNLISNGTYYIIDGGKNIAYSLDNKELTNSEVGIDTLKILTNNPNVTSITGITIPSLTGYTLSGAEYSTLLGYDFDTLGISIFGNKYLTNNNGNNIVVSQEFNCGDTVSAGGFTYTTKIALDGKCWTSQNMKHGSLLSNGSTLPSDTNIIEKWCYNNNSSNCDTYGALYTWSEAMGFPASCNGSSCTQVEDTTKSVCGALGDGWKLPTDEQWTTLTNAGATGWATPGNKLDGLVNNIPGYRSTNSNFYSIGDDVHWWNTAESLSSDAGSRRLVSNNSSVSSGNRSKYYGYSVLCIKN